MSLTVGRDIDVKSACTTKGQPVPTVDFDATMLPPGLGAGLTPNDPAILYLYGTPARAGHYSVPVTATVGDQHQTVVLEIQVDPPPLGQSPGGGSDHASTSTTAPSRTGGSVSDNSTGGAGTASATVPLAVPTYTG